MRTAPRGPTANGTSWCPGDHPERGAAGTGVAGGLAGQVEWARSQMAVHWQAPAMMVSACQTSW
jgi:hypothetical protein